MMTKHYHLYKNKVHNVHFPIYLSLHLQSSFLAFNLKLLLVVKSEKTQR